MATNLKGKGRFVSIVASARREDRDWHRRVSSPSGSFTKSLKLRQARRQFQADKLQSEITQTSTEIKDFSGTKPLPNIPTR